MVSLDVLIGMAISALVALALPFAVFFVFRRRMELRLRNVFVGAGIFVLFALVLETSMHAYLLQGNPATKAWFDANALSYAIYAALAAALFEETGRFLGLHFLAKAVPGNGTPVAYAIGHAGAECVLIAVNIGAIAVLGYFMMIGQLDSLHLPAEATAKIRESLVGATFAMSLLGGVERISAFVFHTAWSLLVWQGVRTRRAIYYLLAVAAHFAIDVPAALAQKKLLPISIGELEAGYALLAVLVLLGIWTFARPAAVTPAEA